MTIASLEDLGYGANLAGAGTYALGGGPRTLTSEPVDLRGRETLHRPKYKVDRLGRQEPVN
jgi:hypothetical protein